MLDIKASDINGRKLVPVEAIQAVVRKIAEKFDPDKIILFGSYAYGDPKPWSDVDLLVVMDSSVTPNQQRRAISQILSPKQFAMDIVIRSSLELQERVPLGDWFLKEILERGKVLYERGHELLPLKQLIESFDPDVDELTSDLDLISDYAVDIRYPSAGATLDEAKEALTAATRVRAFVRGKLGLS